jgi:GTP-binding protein
VKNADIVLAMFDASEGQLLDQELKLLFYAFEQKKMIIVIFNKIDLLDEYKRTLLKQHMQEYAFVLNKLPVVNISCLTKKNVDKIFNEMQSLWQRCQQTFQSSAVDDLVKQELETKPLMHKGTKLRIFKIRHVKARVPTFVVHVNYPEWFGPTQCGCIENILRSHYDLKGCPIYLNVKKV